MEDKMKTTEEQEKILEKKIENQRIRQISKNKNKKKKQREKLK